MVFIENDCEGFPKIKVEPSSFSLEPASPATVLTTARKKMSQAEKHRGWVKMKNVSSVKISIQVVGGWGRGRLSYKLLIDLNLNLSKS